MWIPLMMAAAGAVKDAAMNPRAEIKAREMAAKTMELSPWTGMRPDMGAIERAKADPIGGALQGGAAGMMLMQNQEKAESAKATADAKIAMYKAMAESEKGKLTDKDTEQGNENRLWEMIQQFSTPAGTTGEVGGYRPSGGGGRIPY